MNELQLDTTIAKKAKVKLLTDNKKFESENESALLAVKEVLEKAGLDLNEIDNFSANPGPGSYTGIRIGAAVINALNFALGKEFTPIEPIY